MKKIYLIIFSLFTTFVNSNGSLSNILVDSLKKELIFCTDSVQKVDLLYDIARELSRDDKAATQISIYLEELFQLATKINHNEGLVKYYDMYGAIDRKNGEYA